MVTMTNPTSVSSDGTRRVLWIEGGANDPANLTTEDFASALDVSLYLVHGQDGFNGQRPQDAVTDNRQGSSESRTRPGRKNPSLSIRYVWNAADPADDEARLALTEGASGGFVQLFQVPEDYDPATDGAYDGFPYTYWPVTLGVQERMPEEVNAVDRINQGCFITGPVVDGVVGGEASGA